MKILEPVEIIGVVKDAKYRTLREETLPTVYVSKSQGFGKAMFSSYEMLAQRSAADLIPSVKSVMEQINRDVVISFSTLSVQVGDSLNRERLLAVIFTTSRAGAARSASGWRLEPSRAAF